MFSAIRPFASSTIDQASFAISPARETGFDGQQDHDPVALRVPAVAHLTQTGNDLMACEDFGLLAGHDCKPA